MKKKLVILLSTLMLAVLCLGVACKPGSPGRESSDSTPSAGSSDVVSGDDSSSDTVPVPKYYTVSFAGENVAVPSQNVKEGETALEPNDPVRDGYDFEGWFEEGAAAPYDFTKAVTGDLTLYAQWAVSITGDIAGKGTKESPYLIRNSLQLVSFAERVNEGEEEFYKSWFRLEEDIDMTGVTYTPAGKELILNEGEANEETIDGFAGVFDGNGHTISNLSMNKVVKSGVAYIGLFGRTYMANIYDLTLENIDYSVESYSSNSTVGAYVGGVVGGAILTNFTNVTVTGAIRTSMQAENSGSVGGLAGGLNIQAVNGRQYIVYAENCYTDLETSIYDEGSLEKAAVGGLFGYISAYNGAAAIVNCKTEGKIYGGQFTGGLVGTISSYISIINSSSAARVEATSTEVTYAGGLVGSSTGDSIILDSYATGRVVGVRATSALYQSYAGGVIGYAAADDYYLSFTPGMAVVNSYYSGSISGYDKKSALGTVKEKAEFTKEWILETLKWEEECWSFEGEAKPTSTLAKDVKKDFTLSLSSKESTPESLARSYSDAGGYAMTGELDALSNNSPEVFWNWELADGVSYRFYLPVVKDMTLRARWQDVTAIAKTYAGTGTLHQTIDAGIMILGLDGSLQWINDSVITGTYTYDGEHIIFSVHNSMGEMCGTITDGVFAFIADAGITGEVVYEFVEHEAVLAGEYLSEAGDILTFAGEGAMSFQSGAIDDGDYLSGTYTREGNTLTVTGKYLSNYFSSMTISVEQDGSLTADFTAASGKDYALSGIKFRKYTIRDYSGKEFIGDYNTLTLSMTSLSDQPSQENHLLTFRADGSLNYKSIYSDREGRYYYFETNHVMKIVLEGYVSTLTYDAGENIFYGYLNRGGMSARKPVVITSVSDGDLNGYIIGDHYSAVFVTDHHRYLALDGKYVPDAVISGDFTVGSRVTVQDEEYYVVASKEPTRVGCQLVKIGAEEGSYTLDGTTLTLDGIGGLTGAKKGAYYIYDTLVVILFEDDTIVTFDYTQAKTAGGVITVTVGDAYQGVWYLDEKARDEDGNEYLEKKHYKFVVDGFGHTTLFYLKNGSEYAFNWTSVWGTYTITATGISCQFNSVQHADVVFYYDNNIAYSKSFGYLKDVSFYKDGYTGPSAPPVLPAEYAGAYKGTTESGAVMLNLRGDVTGTYAGQPFVGIYDGDGVVFFVISSVEYRLTFGTETLLQFDGKSIRLTKEGSVTEVIPSAIAGSWSGKLLLGTTEIPVTLELGTDGSAVYNDTVLADVTYDAQTNVIKARMNGGEGNNLAYTMTWNAEENTLSVVARDEENREWKGTLTKAAV